jgi:serine/threonine protein kinase
MDLACGGELLHLINRHHKENLSKGIIDVACPKTVTQFYIAEIIQAVSYLHDNDIIHMDLKPESKS